MAEHGLAKPTISATEAQIHMPADTEQLGVLEMAEHGLAKPTISATEAQLHMPPDAARDAAAGEAEAGGDREAVEDGNEASAFRLAVAFSSLVAIAAAIVGFVRYAQ